MATFDEMTTMMMKVMTTDVEPDLTSGHAGRD